jgi:hypothetical protein
LLVEQREVATHMLQIDRLRMTDTKSHYVSLTSSHHSLSSTNSLTHSLAHLTPLIAKQSSDSCAYLQILVQVLALLLIEFVVEVEHVRLLVLGELSLQLVPGFFIHSGHGRSRYGSCSGHRAVAPYPIMFVPTSPTKVVS